MFEELRGKRLLLLEGGILAKDIINKAHQLGIYVILANWYSVEDAPAKAFADKEYTVNIFDIPAMMKIIQDERIDGIFTAYTDSHLHIYENLCREANLPCFTTADMVDIMVKKDVFKAHCREAGLPVIDEYDATKLKNDEEYRNRVEYPIIIKPVDNSGARGISICHDSSNLFEALERGLEFSKSKTVVVEKYLRGGLTGGYCLADFMIQNGKVYFCDSCDKPANDDDKNNVNLPGAYIYPSRNNDLIRETLMGGVQKFVNNIGYQNGLLCLELIHSGGKIYIIEAQFRYGAKYQEVFLNKEYGFDQLAVLLKLAIDGDFSDYDLTNKLSHDFQKRYALMNILLRKGTITSIQDANEVNSFPNVDVYIPMQKVGMTIIPDGSMIQRFGKVAFSANTDNELMESMRYFEKNLQILDENGDNMVIDSL